MTQPLWVYELWHDDKFIVDSLSENYMYAELHRQTGYSWHHALKYEGWEIRKVTKTEYQYVSDWMHRLESRRKAEYKKYRGGIKIWVRDNLPYILIETNLITRYPIGHKFAHDWIYKFTPAGKHFLKTGELPAVKE